MRPKRAGRDGNHNKMDPPRHNGKAAQRLMWAGNASGGVEDRIGGP